jgi:hypothetical protein
MRFALHFLKYVREADSNTINPSTHQSNTHPMKPLLFSILLAICAATPASAQTAFFDDMRTNLGATTTEAAITVGAPSREKTLPAVPLGTQEGGSSTSNPAPEPSAPNAYVAGTDIWSGPIAGTAAILSVVLIGLVMWLVLGHRKEGN